MGVALSVAARLARYGLAAGASPLMRALQQAWETFSVNGMPMSSQSTGAADVESTAETRPAELVMAEGLPHPELVE